MGNSTSCDLHQMCKLNLWQKGELAVQYFAKYWLSIRPGEKNNSKMADLPWGIKASVKKTHGLNKCKGLAYCWPQPIKSEKDTFFHSSLKCNILC